MRRLIATLIFAVLALAARSAATLFTIDNSLLPSPAGVGANRVQLSVIEQGQVYASWVENGQVHFSALEPHRRRWAPAQAIAASSVENSADENAAPQIVAWTQADGAIRLSAVWTNSDPSGAPKPAWSVSSDGGSTWSSPSPLTKEASTQQFPRLCTLSNGNMLAVWTDERGLCARVLSPSETSDAVIDPCARGAAAIAAHPSAGAWVVYQRVDQGQVHDVGMARYDGASWRRVDALLLHHRADDASLPTESPAIASSASRLAVAWFVPDQPEHRVLVSQAAGADGPFLAPVQVQDVQPLGHPALAVLADGTAYVCWLERYTHDEAGLWLRRISPSGELTVPVLLGTTPSGASVPRIISFKAPPNSPHQLLLAFTAGSGTASQVVTRLVTLPPPSARASEKPCNCPDDLRAAAGHALRGTVRSVDRATSSLVLEHPEIPGALAGGVTRFKADASLLTLVSNGAEIVGKVEQQANDWWLFDARLIIRTSPNTTRSP